ncbi:hypothetical protein Ocin01_16859 [Orchesella cincta]|uniref:Uncharacterized protein n=1 Tax=Orchesella cincta TaxID=48709 RepID=A0A1D2MA26_ORCCI|nr:hypothetical protein Ocin01_16859 [Orchesella cincta]
MGQNSGEDQYIVGYGSLIKTESKNRMCEKHGRKHTSFYTQVSRELELQGCLHQLQHDVLGGYSRNKWQSYAVIFKLPNSDALSAYDKKGTVLQQDGSCLRGNNSVLTSELKLPSGKYWIYSYKARIQKN